MFGDVSKDGTAVRDLAVVLCMTGLRMGQMLFVIWLWGIYHQTQGVKLRLRATITCLGDNAWLNVSRICR